MSEQPKKKKSLVGRILKWTGITLLLLIITIVVLPFVFKGKLIEIAKAEVNKNVNAKVDWGEFDLSLFSSFPDFRFSIQDVRVSGIGEFENDTLAKIPTLKLDLNLMSVISGDNYEINSVYLERPRILAKVLANGKANWDIAKPSTDSAGKPAAEEPSKFKMTLEHFEIKDGYVVYDDASMNVRTVLDSLNHELSGDFTQDNFLMETETSVGRFTQVYEGIAYLNKARLQLNADVDMDMKNMKFTLKDNEVNVNELGLGVAGYFAMPGDDYEMDMKFNAKQAEFKNILSLVPAVYTKDFANVKTAGKLSLDGYVKGTYSEAKNTMPGYGVNLNIADAMFQYPSLPKSVTGINIDVKVDAPSGEPDKMVIDAKKIAMNIGGNPINGKLLVTTPVSDANIDGAVSGKLNLATIRDVIPMEQGEELNGMIDVDVKMSGRMSTIEKGEYEKFNASGQADVQGLRYKAEGTPEMNINAMTMRFTPQFVELPKFDAKIGNSDVQADGRVDNFMQYLFKDQLLKGAFNMRSGTMDLNQFAGGESTAEAKPAQPAEAPSEMSVVEVPSNIDFTLNVNIAKLLYDKLVMQNVSGGVVIRESKAQLSDLKMDALGGKLAVGGTYSTQDRTKPSVDFNLDVTDLDIQQTVKTFNTVEKLAPISKSARGRFSTTLNFATLLDMKMSPVMNSIDAKGRLSTKQVEVEAFEPLKKLDEALKMNKFKKIVLQDVQPIGFRVKDGRVRLDPFNFKMGNIAAEMQEGSTGLDQTISYRWNLAIPRSEFGGAANTTLNNLTSEASKQLGKPVTLSDKVNVAVLFGGTVTEPTVKVSLKEAAANLKEDIKEIGKEIVKEKIDDAKEKARAEADKILKDAQAQADKIKADAAVAAQKVKDEGYKKADEIEKSAKNPLEKIAKKKLADETRKQADAAAKKVTDEANQKADGVMAEARKKADEKLK